MTGLPTTLLGMDRELALITHATERVQGCAAIPRGGREFKSTKARITHRALQP